MNKARYWCAILYPENMISSWEDDIGDLLQIPYAYAIHDKDKLEDGISNRKSHVHLLIAFSNTTTSKHALEVVSVLSSYGHNCCNTIESVFNVRHMYNYLIHDTETCKKKGKFLYPTSVRVTGNNFDIGSFEQLSVSDKEMIIEEIEDCILDNSFTNFLDLVYFLKSNFDRVYLTVLRSYSGYFERIMKGCYHKYQEAKNHCSELNKSAAK